MTCKILAFPLRTTYNTVAPPHPPHLPKPKIQPLLIMLLLILLAPVLLLLPLVLFSSACALSHKLWGACSRVWSWDQATARRCPTQLLWMSSIQSSHATWPNSLPVLLHHCRQCKALTCAFKWIPPTLVATSKFEHTILEKKQLYSTKTTEKPSSFTVPDAIALSTFSRHISCSSTANKSSNNRSAPQQLGERAPLKTILTGLSI